MSSHIKKIELEMHRVGLFHKMTDHAWADELLEFCHKFH